EKVEIALADVEEKMAVGLLRPFDHMERISGINSITGIPLFNPINPINPTEQEALEELASLPRERERVRILFVARALGRASTSLQLENRLAQGLQAAVGLDRGRADKIRELLVRLLRTPGGADQVRRTAALALVELEHCDEEANRLAAVALGQAVAKGRWLEEG